MNRSRRIFRQLIVIGLSVFSLILFGSVRSEASIKQMKFYKEAFAGSKPKCIACHTDKIPKKADGKHDANSYGLKVIATSAEPTAETYKAVGSLEDFEKKSESGEGVIEENEKKEEIQEADETEE